MTTLLGPYGICPWRHILLRLPDVPFLQRSTMKTCPQPSEQNRTTHLNSHARRL